MLTFSSFFKHKSDNRFIAALATLLFLALPAHAEDATDNDSSLEQIHQVIVNSYYSVNGFYNFSANQADKDQKAVIDDAIKAIDDYMAPLSDKLDNDPLSEQFATAASAQFATAAENWKTYKNILKQNVAEVVNTGYPDLRLAGDMADSNIAFNGSMQALYNNLREKEKPSELTETSRSAARTLALMMTKYSARTTSTVSQVYSGGDAEITIDALASQFEALVGKLTSLTTDNATAIDLLDSAKTKWEFIKKSYVNYNENRVNFIVNLYSKKIISDIESTTQG